MRLREEMWVRFEPHVRLAGMPYDFRIYSLILFGVLGTWAAVRCVRAANSIAQGDSGAWSASAWSWSLMAALVAPILPLQPFAFPILCMSAAGIVAALVSHRISAPPAVHSRIAGAPERV
jgi:hypothetical protein